MTFPKIVSSNIELIILEKEVHGGPRVGNVHKTIHIYTDCSISVEEIFVDPSTIMFRKKTLNSEIFDNYYKFSKKHPVDAKIVKKYFLEEGI